MTAAFSRLDIDPELIERARTGDDRACEAIFRHFEEPVYHLALRICQCPDEASDVLQDTFVRALTRLDQYRKQAPFWAWLRQIAVNLCLSRMRRLRRLDFRVLSEEMEAPDRQPGTQLDLAAAFATLPADTRTVVWLYDVEGFSHKEIARLFGRSVSFSKTQLSRARERLRALLDDDQEDSSCVNPLPAR